MPSTVPTPTPSVLRTGLRCVPLPTLQTRKGGTEGFVTCPRSPTSWWRGKNSNPGWLVPEAMLLTATQSCLYPACQLPLPLPLQFLSHRQE